MKIGAFKLNALSLLENQTTSCSMTFTIGLREKAVLTTHHYLHKSTASETISFEAISDYLWSSKSNCPQALEKSIEHQPRIGYDDLCDLVALSTPSIVQDRHDSPILIARQTSTTLAVITVRLMFL